MINQDYILLIFNCHKYRYKAEIQKKGWLQTLPKTIIYFHVIGEPTMKTDFSIDTTNKILYIKVEDDYNSLPKKVIRAYETITKLYSFKYIFKTDDDQICQNMRMLDTIINSLNKRTQTNKFHYGGQIVDVTQSYNSQYFLIHPELPKDLIVKATKYCSGRFYFLSNEAIVDLITKKEEIECEYLEDYAVGYFLNNMFKTTILNLETNKYFTDMEPCKFLEGEEVFW